MQPLESEVVGLGEKNAAVILGFILNVAVPFGPTMLLLTSQWILDETSSCLADFGPRGNLYRYQFVSAAGGWGGRKDIRRVSQTL